jgi:hypothetical protein
MLEDSGEGNELRSMTERNTQATQVRGSRKEITPLLLLYWLYIWIDGVHNTGCFQALYERRTMNYQVRE